MSCVNCMYAGDDGYMCWLHDIDVNPKHLCKDYKNKRYANDEY